MDLGNSKAKQQPWCDTGTPASAWDQGGRENWRNVEGLEEGPEQAGSVHGGVTALRGQERTRTQQEVV